MEAAGSEARRRATGLRLIAFDVDGVLTDGRLYYNDRGEETKAFNTLDGHGLKMLAAAGITLAIITGRRSPTVEHRARNLGIVHLFQGIDDKRATLSALLAETGIPPDAAGYVGDDVVDLPVMGLCGFAAAPANAHPAVRQRAHWVAGARGGEGAVRELCDFVLAAQGKLDAALSPYLSGFDLPATGSR
jgi:3-deoxy-D-manno-octulosonate 8-phosphate phosphatase (KDO 8-P phosphatase)